MDKQAPSHWIRIGFLIGIGFIIPSLITYLLGSFVLIKGIPDFLNSSQNIEMADENAEYMSGFMDNMDQSRDIEILSHREQPLGGQLLILGSLINNSKKTVNSVQLEVELMDDNQEMVYECTEYISHKIKSGEKENFQVKCGCGSTTLPNHTSYTIRVTQANNY